MKKFAFSKKRLNINLLFGIVYFLLGLSYIITNEERSWIGFPFTILGIIYLAYYFYEFKNKYVSIDHDKIRVFTIPKKEVLLNEIVFATYFSDEYTIKTKSKTIKILKSQMYKNQLQEFDQYFQNLKETINNLEK